MDKLELRSKIKSKKPTFKVQDSHKKSRVSSTKWRKPKGIQSKIRLSKKGYCKKVKVGYGSPKVVRGLDKSGLVAVIVSSIKGIESIDAKTQGIIFSSTVGARKKVELVKAATEKKIKLLNLKDADAFLSGVEKDLKDRKVKRSATKKAKATKVENAKAAAKKEDVKEKKAETKKESAKESTKASDKESDKEEKTKAKQEKDKILTKKQ